MPPVHIGDQRMAALYVGGEKLARRYIGEDLVFQAGQLYGTVWLDADPLTRPGRWAKIGPTITDLGRFASADATLYGATVVEGRVFGVDQSHIANRRQGRISELVGYDAAGYRLQRVAGINFATQISDNHNIALTANGRQLLAYLGNTISRWNLDATLRAGSLLSPAQVRTSDGNSRGADGHAIAAWHEGGSLYCITTSGKFGRINLTSTRADGGLTWADVADLSASMGDASGAAPGHAGFGGYVAGTTTSGGATTVKIHRLTTAGALTELYTVAGAKRISCLVLA